MKTLEVLLFPPASTRLLYFFSPSGSFSFSFSFLIIQCKYYYFSNLWISIAFHVWIINFYLASQTKHVINNLKRWQMLIEERKSWIIQLEWVNVNLIEVCEKSNIFFQFERFSQEWCSLKMYVDDDDTICHFEGVIFYFLSSNIYPLWILMNNFSSQPLSSWVQLFKEEKKSLTG